MKKEKSVKRVVGLKYRPNQGVPTVVLKGAGVTADEVLAQAEQLPSGPPLVEDKKLLDQLYRLPVDAPIDPDLFELVAMLLVHIYTLDEQQLQKTLQEKVKDKE